MRRGETATAGGESAAGAGSGLRQQLADTFLWCLGVALALTLFFLALDDDGSYRWLPTFVFNLIVSLGVGFSIHGVFRFALPPLLDRFPGRTAYWTIHLALTLVAVLVGVEIAIRAIAALGGAPAADLRLDVLRVGLIVALIVVGFMVVFDQLRERARTVELRAEQLQREVLQARLSALQARTNPHFLFNSLNSVAALIEEDPEGAERALEKLSRLFRHALDGSRSDWVRLGDELAVARDYLEVERLRLGDRLAADLEVGGGVEGLLVPPLLLQPLVENAILHAVAPRREGGRIEVRAERDGDRLVLCVSDDGPGLGRSPHRGSGRALAELERRLEMVYGGAARVGIGPVAGGGCRVRLDLPVRESA